jgi:translation initiation factor IF-1
MSKEDMIEVSGTITDCLPGSKFIIKLDGNGVLIEGHLSGKMRMNFIKIIVGDRVKLEMSPYDLTKGRITYRSK